MNAKEVHLYEHSILTNSSMDLTLNCLWGQEEREGGGLGAGDSAQPDQQARPRGHLLSC